MITDPRSLLASIPQQRWFGYKDNAISGIEIIDEVVLDEGPPSLVIALIAVDFEGTRIYYQLPLLVDSEGSREVSTDPGRLAVVGGLMARGESVKGNVGVFHFSGPGLDPLAQPPGHRSVRVMEAEQSNTSIVLDEHLILKFFRRLEMGPNPDLELNRLLTHEGFDHVPAQVGEITYDGAIAGDEVSIDLGIAQIYLSEGTDAWADILGRVGALYDEADPADAAEDRRFLTEERVATLLEQISELGDAVASMHVALAREEAGPGFAPEPMTHDDLAEMVVRIEDVLDASEGLAEVAGPLRARIAALTEIEDAGAKTRIHGDLHLGQVMITSRGWAILDFEGEPLRSLEERRAKRSALRDVAGMLRSFNYAAIAALFERCEPDSERWTELEGWARCWEQLARERFLTGYLTKAHEGRFLPADRDSLSALLEAFEIEKALYELTYEEGHRPGWVRIPLEGIRRIVAGS